MITADPKSLLGLMCRRVDDMKPGEFLAIHRRDLYDIPSYEHNGATFTPPDRILGNIVGSGYTHSYYEDPMNGEIVFRRHAETGRVWHEGPDRRQKATQRVGSAALVQTEK